MSKQETEEQEIKGGVQQINDSRGKIQHVLTQTFLPIKSIRARNEKEEQQRREVEEERRESKYMLIQEEGIESSKRNVALEIKWNQCREDMEEPQELYKAIQKQKKKFQEIIEEKEKLIKTLQQDRTNKDEDYINMLKQSKEDIRKIISSMHDQYYNMRRIYQEELESIEKEFMRERQDILNKNKADIKNWIKKHEDSEKKFIDNRWNNEKENEKEIKGMRIKNQQTYAQLKKQIETDIQNLQQCQEDMRALYQLNEEKLTYNLQVLSAKAKENGELATALVTQKRNLVNRYRILTENYKKSDKRYRNINKLLTGKFKVQTRQFKDLQIKFKHFEKSDLEQHTKVEAMKVAEIRKLQTKIREADKIIHIQQLGRQWDPNWKSQAEDVVASKVAMDQNLSKNTSIKDGQHASGDSMQEPSRLQLSEEHLENVINLLIQECNILVDHNRDQENSVDELQPKPEHMNIQERLNVIKKAFKIESMEEFDELINAVYAAMTKVQEEKFLEDELEESGGEEEKEEEEEEEEVVDEAEGLFKEKDIGKERENEREKLRLKLEDHTVNKLAYDPDAILEAISKFCDPDEMYERKNRLAEKNKQKLQQDSERESKEKMMEINRKYWDDFTKVLPEETFRIWNVLDKALYNYYKLLQERQKAIDETSRLHDENEEYKNLLNQYLQINHELIIPPTEMIKINPTGNV